MNRSSIINYVRSKLNYALDPTAAFSEEPGLRDSCNLSHKGCYIGITDPAGNDIAREGFMTDSCSNVLDSIDKCVISIEQRLKDINYIVSQLVVASVFVTVVEDCKYIADPLQWDINKDGVYFQWGDKYRGLYLPYQIRNMNLTKIDILDRLVSRETNLACNLWRTECGLVFALKCQTIS